MDVDAATSSREFNAFLDEKEGAKAELSRAAERKEKEERKLESLREKLAAQESRAAAAVTHQEVAQERANKAFEAKM